MAAHAMLPLHKANHFQRCGAGIIGNRVSNSKGWPVVRGGSQQTASALAEFFT